MDEARAIGAQPVLVTSIVRRNFTPDGKFQPDSLAPYVEGVRKLAAEKQAPLIDLYALTPVQAERLGPDGCSEIDALNAAGKRDHTHLGPKGQQENGAMCATAAIQVIPSLKIYLRAGPVER